MSDRREDDFNDIAWPGFVDILSAVIIMFVFFLMIVATALFFHIIIYKSQVKADLAIEEVIEQSDAEFSQIQTEFAETNIQDFKVSEERNELIIFFNDESISVLEDIKAGVKAELQKYLENGIDPSSYSVTLQSSKPDIGLTNIVRRISTARMLNVRNVVIDAGFPTKVIVPRMVDGEEIDGNPHWVKIGLEKKK